MEWVSQAFPYSLTHKLLEFEMVSGEAIKEIKLIEKWD